MEWLSCSTATNTRGRVYHQ
ncbi:unnamed protein product, partial [Allacma fusca]